MESQKDSHFLYVELSFLGITDVERIYKYNYLVFLSLLNLSFLFFVYFLLFSPFTYNHLLLFPELLFLLQLYFNRTMTWPGNANASACDTHFWDRPCASQLEFLFSYAVVEETEIE
jgi:hypothetical protein